MAFASIVSWPFRFALPLQLADFMLLAAKAFLPSASEPFTNAAFIIIRIGSLLQAAAVLTTSVLKSNLRSDYIGHPMALQSMQP